MLVWLLCCIIDADWFTVEDPTGISDLRLYIIRMRLFFEILSPRAPKVRAKEANTMKYRCIHCLEPSDTLYKKLGDIKLTACQKCGELVDEYCERESLLVVLDLLLLRESAYRHLLNIDIECSIVLISILSAHIGAIGHQDRVDAEHSLASLLQYGLLAVVLMVANVLQGKLLNDQSAAVFAYFNILVIFVHLWENSQTIRTMGYLLIVAFQLKYLHVVCQATCSYVPLVRFAVSIFAKCAVLGILWKLVARDTVLPCPGIALQFLSVNLPDFCLA